MATNCASCGMAIENDKTRNYPSFWIHKCEACAHKNARNGFDECLWMLTSWESPFVAIALMVLFFGGCFYLATTLPNYLQAVDSHKETQTDK